MEPPDSEISDRINDGIKELEKIEKEHVDVTKDLLGDSGAIYPIDFMAVAALNRSLAHTAAFKFLIKDRNYICSASILRLQLDTALRFYAGFIVSNPSQFAMDVLGGQQINKMRDAAGNIMTDRHLVNHLGRHYPWIVKVYQETSGFIHFSAKHLLSAIQMNDETGKFSMKVSALDRKMPDSVYLTAMEAFCAVTSL
jgi:hypothetical protein